MVLWEQTGGRVMRCWPQQTRFTLGVITSVPMLVKVHQEMRPREYAHLVWNAVINMSFAMSYCTGWHQPYWQRYVVTASRQTRQRAILQLQSTLCCRRELNYTLCLKKHPDVFRYNSRKHCRIFIIFGRNITKKASNQMLYCRPHLINASALPCKTESTENLSFHVKFSCWFVNTHTSHIGITTSSLIDYYSFMKR